MSKLKVKHFGPIKSGLEQDAFFELDKVTLFIGNQATGKSSVAKLFSTISWLEKAITRGDLKVNDVVRYNRFVKKYCDYQGLKNYFKADTEIEYQGNAYKFLYVDGKLEIEKIEDHEYLPPKIMYVPAERNFLSVIEDPQKVKNLPLPLYTFLDEFERSKVELKASVELPINKVRFEYQKQNKISYISGVDFKLRLHESSSGIQSLLPVFLVSRNLAQSITRRQETNIKKISVEQERRIRGDIERILGNTKLSDDIKNILIEKISSTYQNLCFVNVVEEIEQNLFPSSQQNLLNELLKFNNSSMGNKLVLTSHSPYILNYLTIAIKGAMILNNNLSSEALQKMEEIVPKEACISPEKVNIYQFLEDGTVKQLSNYRGIPSDNNFLNTSLHRTNELFDGLLELEEEALLV